jgi:hypothetical protein
MNTNKATIDIPNKYTNLLGSHTTLKEKFVVIEGKVVKEQEKLFFINGEKEELWKAIPYRILKDGDNLGICIISPGITMVVKGIVKQMEIKTKTGNRTSWVWQGPGEVTVPITSLLERLAPFLNKENKIEIVIWK